jgi:putative signal transducing protein
VTVDLNEVGAHCPVCGTEYRPGFDACHDDGTALVPGPAPEHGPWNPAKDDAAPARLPVGPQTPAAERLPWEEAWLLAGRLESEGIPAVVYPPDYASAYGEVLARGFQVLVPEGREAEARAILESVSRGE